MTNIFISYAREDIDTAMRLYFDLRAAGANPWIDKENIIPGQNWKLEIKKAIRSSDYVIALFSKTSAAKKGYFQKEVRLALEELDEMPPGQISLIPCRIDDVDIRYESIRDLNFLDLFPSYSDSLRKLILALGIADPATSEFKDYREIITQVSQNLLRYQLRKTSKVLSEPMVFAHPTWVSEVRLRTNRASRRVKEAITQVQETIPLLNFNVSEIGNREFILCFKHIRAYSEFEETLIHALQEEGIEVLGTRTEKDEVTKGQSAFIITDDPTEVLFRQPDGRKIFSNQEGYFDAETGEKLSDDELQEMGKDGGFSVRKD